MGILEDNNKESLIRSMCQQRKMIHTKRVIFMVLPLLFVPLVYGLSSTPDACAVPADSRFDSAADCKGEIIDGDPAVTCCWREKIPGSTLGEVYCQSCFYGSGGDRDCDPKELQMMPLPSDLPQAEQVPTTPPPMFGFGQNVPQDLQTLEQQTPPRFGQNVPQDLQTLQETPPSPLPPPPEQPDVEEQDESSTPEQPSDDEQSPAIIE
jgi:hypothetical protein